MTLTITHGAMAVLRALNEYQYMIGPQMVEIGISKSERSIREKILPRLKKRKNPLVEWKDFGALPKKGRLHTVYCLSKYGAAALAEADGINLNAVEYPRGGIQYVDDYFHRVATVDFHIQLDHWADEAEAKIKFFTAYFEKVRHGTGRKTQAKFLSKNSIALKDRNIVPDGIFMFEIAGKKRLCILEIHYSDKTRRIYDQLTVHMRLLAEGSINNLYEHDKAPFVLSVYENRGQQENIKKRLLNDPGFEAFKKLFLFNTIENFKKRFSSGWHYANGEYAKIFPVAEIYI